MDENHVLAFFTICNLQRQVTQLTAELAAARQARADAPPPPVPKAAK